MEAEFTKQLATDVNNVVEASMMPLQEQINKLQAQLKAAVEPLQTKNEKLKKVLELILNENFSGQSTLSSYVKRIAEQALKG